MKKKILLTLALGALVVSACGPILPTITPSDTPNALVATATYLPTIPAPVTPTATLACNGCGGRLPVAP